MMGIRVLIIFLLLILVSDEISFGRKKSTNCKNNEVQILSKNEENVTEDHHYDCDALEYGIVQKIPYMRSCPSCDMIKIDFESACIRCGMCLAIADQINQTLLDVYEEIPNSWLNNTEIELLLRTICNQSFQHYSLREVNGIRYISDRLAGSIMVATSADGLWGKKLKELCHFYLDEIGEMSLYKKWQLWCNDDEENFPNIANVLCRSMHGVLRDCRSMEDTEKYKPTFKTYNAKIRISAIFDKYIKRGWF